MEQTVQIRIRNNNETVKAPMGSTLEDIYQLSGLKMEHGPYSARVNNQIEGMHYRVFNQKDVDFLDITSPSGNRCYTRSLFFVLCKAAHDLYPNCKVWIDIPVSNGYYVYLDIERPVTLDDAGAIRRRMQEIIDSALPDSCSSVPSTKTLSIRISSFTSSTLTPLIFPSLDSAVNF